MKKLLMLLLVVAVSLSVLAACSKDDEPQTEAETADTAIVKEEEKAPRSKWDILEARMGDEDCPVTVFKRPGGQATGLACYIAIPLGSGDDLTAVPLELTLVEGAVLSQESPCIVEVDGWSVVVDLTVEDPSITVENDGHGRTYYLFTEDELS